MSDDELLAMLRVIDDRNDDPDPVDSSGVAERLGWSAAVTASSLLDAKARLLIWAIRVGGLPSPQFENIELTVQGRRRLRPAGGVGD